MDSAAQLLPLIFLVVLFWLLIIRPARNRQRQAQQTQSSLHAGQQVMTTAGLYATVSSVEDDAVFLEVAPGVVSRYAKAAVARIQSDPAADLERDAGTEQDAEGDQDQS